MSPIVQLLLFIAVLAVLKFAFGLPVSILGSVLLTVALTLVVSAFQRRERGAPRY